MDSTVEKTTAGMLSQPHVGRQAWQEQNQNRMRLIRAQQGMDNKEIYETSGSHQQGRGVATEPKTKFPDPNLLPPGTPPQFYPQMPKNPMMQPSPLYPQFQERTQPKNILRKVNGGRVESHMRPRDKKSHSAIQDEAAKRRDQRRAERKRERINKDRSVYSQSSYSLGRRDSPDRYSPGQSTARHNDSRYFPEPPHNAPYPPYNPADYPPPPNNPAYPPLPAPGLSRGTSFPFRAIERGNYERSDRPKLENLQHDLDMAKARRLPGTELNYTISEDDTISGWERSRRQLFALECPRSTPVSLAHASSDANPDTIPSMARESRGRFEPDDSDPDVPRATMGNRPKSMQWVRPGLIPTRPEVLINRKRDLAQITKREYNYSLG